MLQPDSSNDREELDLTSIHARELQAAEGESDLSRLHAEVCARRQIELNDQSLRSFVVRHSVVRIHCVFASMIVLIALTLVGQMHADVLLGALMLASMTVAASWKNISGAIASGEPSAR